MFAYIDESGHTGKNIFDTSQPFFYYICAMSQEDIDVAAQHEFEKILHKLGVSELHSYKLGKRKIESILPELQDIINNQNIKFNFYVVDKKWFALCKFFDAVCDSGENIAMPWMVYNVPALRHAMLFKVASIISIKNLQDFYFAITQKKEDVAQDTMVKVLQDIHPYINNLPDSRSREILGDAFEWAIKYPSEFYLNFRTKKSAYSHLPNIPALVMLLRGLVLQAQSWDTEVQKIKHDRQEQLFNLLHDNFSLMFDREFKESEFMGQNMSFGGLNEANFQACSASNSYGIQLVDVVLWCAKNYREKEEFRTNIIEEFMDIVFANTNNIQEISSKTSENIASQCWHGRELSETDYQRARCLLNQQEAKRKKAMQEFETKQ